jgi:hypothetical protein
MYGSENDPEALVDSGEVDLDDHSREYSGAFYPNWTPEEILDARFRPGSPTVRELCSTRQEA